MRRILAASLVLAALLLLPGAAAQLTEPVDRCTRQCDPHAEDVNGAQVKTGDETAKAVLYFHQEDAVGYSLVNVQAPDPKERDFQVGFLMPTLDTKSGTPADTHFTSNSFGALSSAGFVEISPEGVWRSHQEPGLAEDMQIVGDKIPLYFYLSAYPVPNQNSETGNAGTTAAAAVPQVALRASINVGRTPGTGPVIAEGDSAQDGRVNVLMVPGQTGKKEVYEIQVNMHVKQSVLPSVWTTDGKGYTVQMTPYQVRGEDPVKDYEFTQAEWRAHFGPKTPPHMVIDVAKPLSTKAARLTHFNNNLFARWSVLSPWGSYDLEESSIRIEVSGPTIPSDPGSVGLARPKVFRSTDHDGHFKPTNITWKIDYRKAGLADGDYTLRLSVNNLQNTYERQETLAFRMVGGVPEGVEYIGGAPGHGKGLNGGPAGKSPGLAGMAVLVALIGVALVRRRGA